MRIVRFTALGRSTGAPAEGTVERAAAGKPAGGEPARAGPAFVGYLDGDHVVPVADARGPGRPAVELAMAVNADPSLVPSPIGPALDVFRVVLHCPIETPPSIRDFYAFERHVEVSRRRRGLAMDPAWYELPVFYFSNPSALTGPGHPVAAPPRSRQLDYELEVALVVGRDGSGVGVKGAGEIVAGFAVMNDWSARDVQAEEMRLSLGPAKGKDFATTIGPWLVTRSELDPAGDLRSLEAGMRARVNGNEYSAANLSEMWWSFAEMIAYASEASVLRAGDVLGSGTCGTGCILELSLVHGSAMYPYLVPGDIVDLDVDGLGTLSNPVVETTAVPFSPLPRRGAGSRGGRPGAATLEEVT
ncbi:MAG: fumarylacetoacetate hydrolase family protein [Acidimicrobiales bacterium]